MSVDNVMTSRSFSALFAGKAIWLLPLLALIVLVVVGIKPLDFAIENIFYISDGGFYAKHNWLLETVLHDYAKRAMMLVAILILIMLFASFWLERFSSLKPQLIYLTVAITMSTLIVTPLKLLTNIHCPWDLQQFGGSFIYVHMLDARLPQSEAGRCWPGGHAASGFCWFAFYFVFRDSRPKIARVFLFLTLFFGTVFSVGRMIQGAHFLSHNLATALIDWLICYGVYRIFFVISSLSGLRLQILRFS